MAAVDRAVLDTNVLLGATDEGRRDHSAAVAAINDWPAAGIVLYISGQILREYLVVATRPTTQNGLGLSRSSALGNADAFRSRMDVLPEDLRVVNRLADLVRTVDCAGKQIHDASVVATMLVHGIGSIATANTADFARFGDVVSVIPL